jgi:hypothetical protein
VRRHDGVRARESGGGLRNQAIMHVAVAGVQGLPRAASGRAASNTAAASDVATGVAWTRAMRGQGLGLVHCEWIRSADGRERAPPAIAAIDTRHELELLRDGRVIPHVLRRTTHPERSMTR